MSNVVIECTAAPDNVGNELARAAEEQQAPDVQAYVEAAHTMAGRLQAERVLATIIVHEGEETDGTRTAHAAVSVSAVDPQAAEREAEQAEARAEVQQRYEEEVAALEAQADGEAADGTPATEIEEEA